MAVVYEEAVRCTSAGPTPGCLACAEQWYETTGLGNYGICSCRPPRGSSSGYSIHAECRAVDLACSAFRLSQKRDGDAYAAWLIAHDDELGCQGIIWNRESWRSGRGWRQYSGVNPHTDHLHVELTRYMAWNPPILWEVDWRADDEEAELSAVADDIVRRVVAAVVGDGDVTQQTIKGQIDEVQQLIVAETDRLQQGDLELARGIGGVGTYLRTATRDQIISMANRSTRSVLYNGDTRAETPYVPPWAQQILDQTRD